MKDFNFWSKVKKGDGCWKWMGYKLSSGYGTLSIRRHQFYAHRIAWELSNGKIIPAGMHICHHCDNQSCVRPDHLFLGTAKDNFEDMMSKGRGKIYNPMHGESNGNASLKEVDVREIRRIYSEAPRKQRIRRGKLAEIANKYGITGAMVLLIVKRKSWKEVM